MKRKIVAAREIPELTPTGELIRMAVYEYTLDDLGPFTFRIPVAEDSSVKLNKAMDEKEKILQAAAK